MPKFPTVFVPPHLQEIAVELSTLDYAEARKIGKPNLFVTSNEVRYLPHSIEVLEEVAAAKKQTLKNKKLNKPFRTPNAKKKFGVYVKNKNGNVILIRFGDSSMEIRRDDPEARKNFRARHQCDTAKDKTTPRYWSCRMWEEGTTVSEVLASIHDFEDDYEWNGSTFFDEVEIRASFSEGELEGIEEVLEEEAA